MILTIQLDEQAVGGAQQRLGLAEMAQAQIGRSQSEAHLRSSFSIPREDLVDIPNGVDVGRLRQPVEFDLRDHLGLEKHAFVVLSVGRESWAKDYETGIRAFTSASSGASRFYYVIIGRGVGRWNQLRSELPGARNVILCEGLYEDELIGAYQQADIFFLPSIKETFPLVLLEALAAIFDSPAA